MAHIRSEPHVLFQEMLLQLVQQGVRLPHVGFLQEGQVAPLIECPPPCGFEFLPEFPPEGLERRWLHSASDAGALA